MKDVASLERICRQLPKSDLHLHLDGSVRPETIVDLASKTDPPKPLDLETARKKMKVNPESRSLPDYLTKFPFVNGFLQRPEVLERVTRELVEDCAEDRVRIAEVRFCPQLHTLHGATAAEILDAVLAGFQAGCAATGVKGGVIVDCLRELSAEVNERMAELAVANRDRGVVALDLAGNEAGLDTKSSRSAFELAGKAGLRRIAHAGEAGGPDSIRQAMEGLGAERIGHGTRLLGDPKLSSEIVERGIPLEVCITSNVQTRAVSDYESHPFPRYLRSGVRVTINTDNRTVSGTSASHELAIAWHFGELSREELKRLILNGVDASFLPSEVKGVAREEFAVEIDDVLSRTS